MTYLNDSEVVALILERFPFLFGPIPDKWVNTKAPCEICAQTKLPHAVHISFARLRAMEEELKQRETIDC